MLKYQEAAVVEKKFIVEKNMLKIKNYFTSFLGFSISLLIIAGIISVLAIFGGFIMHMFGFQYQSIGQLLLFFLFVAVIGFPMEIFAKAFPKALLSLNKFSLQRAKVLFVLLDTLSTMITMTIVDYFMDSVSTTFLSVAIIGFFMAMTNTNDIKK